MHFNLPLMELLMCARVCMYVCLYSMCVVRGIDFMVRCCAFIKSFSKYVNCLNLRNSNGSTCLAATVLRVFVDRRETFPPSNRVSLNFRSVRPQGPAAHRPASSRLRPLRPSSSSNSDPRNFLRRCPSSLSSRGVAPAVTMDA